jgi:hypothetical protein
VVCTPAGHVGKRRRPISIVSILLTAVVLRSGRLLFLFLEIKDYDGDAWLLGWMERGIIC